MHWQRAHVTHCVRSCFYSWTLFSVGSSPETRPNARTGKGDVVHRAVVQSVDVCRIAICKKSNFLSKGVTTAPHKVPFLERNCLVLFAMKLFSKHQTKSCTVGLDSVLSLQLNDMFPSSLPLHPVWTYIQANRTYICPRCTSRNLSVPESPVGGSIGVC